MVDGALRHGLADFLETELPRLKSEWERGSFSALMEAFIWCSGNGYTFPDWLSDAVQDELSYSMAHRPRGGTKQGNAVAIERANRIHSVRYHLVDQNLWFQRMDLEAGERSSPQSVAEAARDAASYLRDQKHEARGSEAAIMKSYKLLRKG